MSKKQQSTTKQENINEIIDDATEEEKTIETIQEIVTPVQDGGKHKDGIRNQYSVEFDNDSHFEGTIFLLTEEELKLHHDYLMDLELLLEKNDKLVYKPHSVTMITEEKSDIEEYVEHEPTIEAGTQNVAIDNNTDIVTVEGERHTYEQNSPALHGDMPLKITFEDVRDYLASKMKYKPSNAEIKLFVQFCLTNQLDPFANDAYMIKYDKNSPATFQVSRDLYLKRADQLPDYRGFEAGIIVYNPKNKTLEEREGSFYISEIGEKLYGAYAIVYRQGMKPFRIKVTRNEYDKKNYIWADKPATMLRKVAIAQALRDAFPNAYAGLYMQEEMTDNNN